VRIVATDLPGAKVVELETIEDERGFFARSYCAREFEAEGLEHCVAQCNVSYNRRRGTLRGMHFQRTPHAEAKLVRCTRGAIYDVIIDLRPESATFRRWVAAELTADNRLALYVPRGFAHGFQTLTDDSEVFYQMSEFYVPDAASGVRWNDPAFAVAWPIANPILSPRDASYADFSA
jgi:dTDP-4-dehydrorhamnose 3,5-epimerase